MISSQGKRWTSIGSGSSLSICLLGASLRINTTATDTQMKFPNAFSEFCDQGFPGCLINQCEDTLYKLSVFENGFGLSPTLP
mmetsp:Transcript_27277/g.63952  ORF Transcript_27277/g.63952 Transcript_27277/m.63952 type:complete len:82 (-) Transcript_27277:56-301(-)